RPVATGAAAAGRQPVDAILGNTRPGGAEVYRWTCLCPSGAALHDFPFHGLRLAVGLAPPVATDLRPSGATAERDPSPPPKRKQPRIRMLPPPHPVHQDPRSDLAVGDPVAPEPQREEHPLAPRRCPDVPQPVLGR